MDNNGPSDLRPLSIRRKTTGKWRAKVLGSPLTNYLALAIVATISVYGAIIIVRQLRLCYWPSVHATVLEFEPRERPADGNTCWYANPRIKYEFQVDGVRYTGEALNPSPFNYQSEQALQ